MSRKKTSILYRIFSFLMVSPFSNMRQCVWLFICSSELLWVQEEQEIRASSSLGPAFTIQMWDNIQIPECQEDQKCIRHCVRAARSKLWIFNRYCLSLCRDLGFRCLSGGLSKMESLAGMRKKKYCYVLLGAVSNFQRISSNYMH